MKQICFDVLESTQTTARMLLDNESVPYVVFTGRQTQGYGKYGRAWQSEIGNFTATFAMEIDVDNVLQKLPMWLGLQIISCLNGLVEYDLDLKLKWPNDILLKGKKIGGILIERLGNVCLIGVGLNLKCVPRDLDAPYAVGSIWDETGVLVEPRLLLKEMLTVLAQAKTTLNKTRPGVIRDAYTRVLYGLGMPVKVVSRRRVFEGILKDIQIDGAAVVSVEDKEEKIYAADIFV